MPTPAVGAPGGGEFVLTPDLPYLPNGFESSFKNPYIYPLTFLNLPKSGQASDNIPIDANSYFVCEEMNATVSDEATGLTVVAADAVPIMIELKDSASSTFFQQSPFRMSTAFGTGERPNYWAHRGLIFRPSSNISVTLTNLDTVNAWRVDLTFKGFQIFNLPDQLEF